MPAKRQGGTDTPASTTASNGDASASSESSRHYLLRTATANDIEQLGKLERAVFPNVWPPTNFAREIKKSGQTVFVVIVRSEPEERGGSERNASFVERVVGGIRTLTATGGSGRQRSDRVAGWVVVWFVVGEAHIASIGVAESDRRRGVGELLVIRAVGAAADNACDELTLEVRKSNTAAQALYRKYGFRDVGERKGYYVHDNEDALIMTTPDIREPAYATRLTELAVEHARRWEEVGSHFERG